MPVCITETISKNAAVLFVTISLHVNSMKLERRKQKIAYIYTQPVMLALCCFKRRDVTAKRRIGLSIVCRVFDRMKIIVTRCFHTTRNMREKKNRRKMHIHTNERRLVVPGACCVVNLIEIFCFTFIPFWTSNK